MLAKPMSPVQYQAQFGVVRTAQGKVIDDLMRFTELCRGEVPWSPTAEVTWISLDGTPAERFEASDIKRFIAVGVDPHDDVSEYVGKIAAVIQLKDGRYVAWESFTDYSGTGFHGDVYGGGAAATCSASLEEALQLGLTPEGRELLQAF